MDFKGLFQGLHRRGFLKKGSKGLQKEGFRKGFLNGFYKGSILGVP